MMLCVSSLLLIISLVLMPCDVHGADWNNEVATGEHLDDLIGSTDGKRNVAKNTLLVIHKSSCPPQVNRADLPYVAYMYFLRFDAEKFPQDIWYKTAPSDDLTKRYLRVSNRCQTAVFLAKGTSLDSSDHPKWNPLDETTLEDWAWLNLEVTLKFENNYGETLIISQEGKSGAPTVRGGFIYHGEDLTMKSYPGFRVFVKKEDRSTIVYNDVVGVNNKTYSLEDYIKSPNLHELVDQEHTTGNYANYLVDMHYFRVVQLLKQPLFCHNYTELGYKKMQMPGGMYSYIKDFFDSNYIYKRDEGYGRNELLVINKAEVSTAMVDLTEEAKAVIIAYVQPILEDWCQCELEFKVAYGIREYYKGNVLHNHVDSVQTHVVSALINVDQELDEGEDWLLEVTRYDGTRHEVKMDIGDMVLYESAKLIHGRPKPFLGKRYTNCFFHFAPTTGWDYTLESGVLSTKQSHWTESLDDLSFHKDKRLFTKIEL